jgi:hypothetical protein
VLGGRIQLQTLYLLRLPAIVLDIRVNAIFSLKKRSDEVSSAHPPPCSDSVTGANASRSRVAFLAKRARRSAAVSAQLSPPCWPARMGARSKLPSMPLFEALGVQARNGNGEVNGQGG